MSRSGIAPLAVVALLCAGAPPAAAQSTTPLQAGLELYAAAAYEDALTALDAASGTDLSVDDRTALEQHRMLCLLALGRAVAADAAAASLLQAKPDFLLTANDASPRVRATFDETRRRVLPSVVRDRYAEAKQLFDAGSVERAHASFTALAGLLDNPDVRATDATFADLRTLVQGFRQLSAPSAIVSAADRAPAMPVASSPLPASRSREDTGPSAEPATLVAAAATRASRPFEPIEIFTYDARDTDVTPPVVMSQKVQGWWGSMGEPAAGTTLGAVDVIVDATGRVVEARIHQSVNRIYDAALLTSAREWRFKPATRHGRAVKYRRVTNVVSGR